ncbi:tetratricopeptide repeat protein [Mucilaginibacter sp.]|uniref:tetratricopeptide repeat protein n=1 Tax=Mucilaginibacter sp. TaxID=1882438 RepID=UPI003D0AC09E
MDNEYTVQDIINFINGKMDSTAAADFSAAVKQNTKLASEVTEQKQLARLVQIAAIKGKLDVIQQPFVSSEADVVEFKPKAKQPLVWLFLAVAATIAGMAFFLFFYNSSQDTSQKIFAQYFQDDNGLPSLMGANATAMDEAMVYYKAGDHQTATAKFDALLASDPKNDTVRYYDALCKVRLKNENDAIKLLSSINSQNKDGLLYTKVRWYTALVLIHQEKIPAAVVILKQIAAADAPDYKQQAADILAKLKYD